MVYLVDRGHLRLTTEHTEVWKPLREAWREAQKNQDDPNVIEFRDDVARIYDRAVKRAVHAFENGPAAGRQKRNLERYRYENLQSAAQAAAVDLTIQVLDRLMRKSESLEEAKRMEAAKATIQGMVRELADRGFLAITHDFRVAYETWRAKERSADEAPGDTDKATEEAAAKRALHAAALACCKVAVFAAANASDPTIRERFQPYKTRRLTPVESSWVTSEARDILERLLFQGKTVDAAAPLRQTIPSLAGPAQAADTFPDLAAGETQAVVVADRPGARNRRRSGGLMIGALLLAESIGVAIGGMVGLFAGQKYQADRAAARASAYRAEAQKAIDDVGQKANRLAEMNLQLANENKTLKESLRKLQAVSSPDLAGENAGLKRINQALSKQNQELVERVKAQDHTLDELRNERDSRHYPNKGGHGRKK
jgi:hypothetical protein